MTKPKYDVDGILDAMHAAGDADEVATSELGDLGRMLYDGIASTARGELFSETCMADDARADIVAMGMAATSLMHGAGCLPSDPRYIPYLHSAMFGAYLLGREHGDLDRREKGQLVGIDATLKAVLAQRRADVSGADVPRE